MKKVGIEQFRDAARRREQFEDGCVLFLDGPSAAPPAPVGNRIIRFTLSKESPDRAGDSIKVKGWIVEKFLSNPIAPFAHKTDEPPIGRWSNLSIANGMLCGDLEFASADVYPLADTLFKLVKGKFLNAVSVGFRPIKWAFSSDKSREGGIDFLQQELLECSLVPIPCHPDALVQARAAGIDVSGVSRAILRASEEARQRRIADVKIIVANARRSMRG